MIQTLSSYDRNHTILSFLAFLSCGLLFEFLGRNKVQLPKPWRCFRSFESTSVPGTHLYTFFRCYHLSIRSWQWPSYTVELQILCEETNESTRSITYICTLLACSTRKLCSLCPFPYRLHIRLFVSTEQTVSKYLLIAISSRLPRRR